MAAVVEALRTWERELEGLVRFRLVADRREARLELRLHGEEAPAPHPDLQVLGKTPIASACRVNGGAGGAGAARRSSSPCPRSSSTSPTTSGCSRPTRSSGSRCTRSATRSACAAHSPIPADVMYEVVRDRVTVRELSLEDVNSFVSLYRLPNGTVYARVPAEGAVAPPPPGPPPGPPELAIAPYVDVRLGFKLRPPAGWMQVPTAQGVVAVDGVTWDYTASFQVVVHRYPTLEAYMERYGDHYLTRGPVLGQRFRTLRGKRAFEIEIGDPTDDFLERTIFVETGDGRIVAVIEDCPIALADAYRPWFDAALDTLEIR